MGQQKQYGKQGNVVQDGNPYSLLWTPLQDDASKMAVQIQAQSIPGRPNVNVDPNNPYLVCIIRWTIGETQFSRVVPIASTRRIQIPVYGRNVEVVGQVVNPRAAQPNLVVNVGAIPEDAIESQSQFSPFASRSGPNSNQQLIYGPGQLKGGSAIGGAGVLLMAQIQLTAFPNGGAPVWACFYDAPSGAALVNLQAPIPLGVSPPLTANNQAYTFSDELNPATEFSSGLVFALSLDPDAWTAPPNTYSWVGDFKVGI